MICEHIKTETTKNEDHTIIRCLVCDEIIDYCVTYMGYLARGGKPITMDVGKGDTNE